MSFPRLSLQTSRTSNAFIAEPALESIYRDLFLREFATLGEEDRFFPVGGAANFSLLYLVLRIGMEFRPRSVLDIGAGQTSLLWSILQKHGMVETVVTLESDPAWAARIAAQVQHEICVSPLLKRKVSGYGVRTYDWEQVVRKGPFDAIVCDGPNGTPRRSRFGVIELLRQPPTDFVLVLDDVERTGEQDTVRAVHIELQRANVEYQVGVTRAAKSQAVFAAGRFAPASFL